MLANVINLIKLQSRYAVYVNNSILTYEYLEGNSGKMLKSQILAVIDSPHF